MLKVSFRIHCTFLNSDKAAGCSHRVQIPYPVGTRGSVPGSTAAGVWSWSLAST